MTLIACSLSEVEDVVAQHAPSHVVTLLGPKVEDPKCLAAPAAARLHPAFNDIVEAAEGLTLPGVEHVEQLITFARGWDRTAPMLVHCWAGVSRSTAAAYIAATDRLGPGSEDVMADALRRASATATPNSRMIALADAALGPGGAMTRAIKATGRGVEAPAGAVFELEF